MAVALPAGYVDNDFVTSYSASGSLAVLCVPTGFGAPSGIQGLIGDWDLIDNSFASGFACPPGQAEGVREVLAQNSGLAIGPISVWTEAFT